MTIQKINPRTLVLLAFIVVLAIIRILFSLNPGISPVATFTSLGAMAVFAGAYFQKSMKAYLFVLITLWLSDVVLNRVHYFNEWVFFYKGWYFVYAAFALVVFAGQRMIRKVNAKNIALASLAATLIHWIVTSPACMIGYSLFSADTWEVYFLNLKSALIFERNFLVGTLVYSGIFFGLFEWAKTKFTVLQTAQ
jgi:hypothetical protein